MSSPQLSAYIHVFGDRQSEIDSIGRYFEFFLVKPLRFFSFLDLYLLSIHFHLGSLYGLICFVEVMQFPIHLIIDLVVLFCHFIFESVLYL